MMTNSTNTKAAILRELEYILELHSWFPKTHEYPHVWEWYKGMKWGDQQGEGINQ